MARLHQAHLACALSVPVFPHPHSTVLGTYCDDTGDKVSEDVVRQVPSAEDQLLGLVIA